MLTGLKSNDYIRKNRPLIQARLLAVFLNVCFLSLVFIWYSGFAVVGWTIMCLEFETFRRIITAPGQFHFSSVYLFVLVADSSWYVGIFVKQKHQV